MEEPWTYLSRSKINASFRKTPQTFFVEEILSTGTRLKLGEKYEEKDEEGEYLKLVVEKRNWATIELAKEMAKRLKISAKRISFAGNKDKNATTIQLFSIYRGTREMVENLTIKDVAIRGAWRAKEPVKLGELLGNHFHVVFSREDERVWKIYKELEGVFPNYFGAQRFGSPRPITHLIGEALVKNEMRRAVELYLMEGDDPYRKRLAEERDFKKALHYFPKHMRFERTLLGHLSQHPRDYTNALRKLPRQLLLMFVHAFQAYLFNLTLSERLEEGPLEKEEGEYYCGQNQFDFPDLEKRAERGYLVGKVLGYDIKPNEREREILERFEITPQNFKIKSLPEASSPGTRRLLLAPILQFQAKGQEISFALPSGSYATALLREFLKAEPWLSEKGIPSPFSPFQGSMR